MSSRPIRVHFDARYDAVIVGGGPSGLAAALTLGRSRKRVLLCDSGPRRNESAQHLQNFLTQDGTSPAAFRSIGREQLATYPNVEVQDVCVETVSGTSGAFHVRLNSGVTVEGRRVLLCTGMVDELPPIAGLRALWGHTVIHCPYCHGWEVRDRTWGYLVRAENAEILLPFALQCRGWTDDVIVFTDGTLEIPDSTRAQLHSAGIRLETAPVARLIAHDDRLEAVELSNGSIVPCAVLFAHPVQRQVALVRELGVALDDDGYVRIDGMTRETSVAGVYAAGDLTTRMQGAIWAAAAGAHAAVMINVGLTMALVSSGVL